MANVLTGFPLVVDTVTDVSMVSKLFNVTTIRWTSASTADTCVLKDKDGNTRWQSIGNGANYKEESSFPVDRPLVFNGLMVQTLGSGTVFIYTKENDPV